MAKVTITRQYIQEAMKHPAVLEGLRAIAQRTKVVADNLASSEKVEMETWLKESVRPGGRPQVQVYGDNPGQEFGDSRTDRRRILGRAAEAAS